MYILSHLGLWEWLLVFAVSVQATIAAYLYEPKWKAFMLTIPIPFTLATLSVGCQVGVYHVTGLILLFIFTHGVRVFHYTLKLPILISILISAVLYCLIGSSLTKIIPNTQQAFWIGAIVVFVLISVSFFVVSCRVEPGHRTPLPVWIKFPIIVIVILCLISIKQYLLGFMTVFPMMGVIVAYEAKNCLWTISRRIIIALITLLAMMISINLSYNSLGLYGSLGAAWIVFVFTLFIIIYAWDKVELYQKKQNNRLV